MAETEGRTRIVIAVTEPAEVGGLWETAMQRLGEHKSELLAVFLNDERWLRAASLPFTREFSRFGGAAADFTPARAERLSRDTIADVERSIRELATKASLPLSFRVLSDAESSRIVDVVGEGNTLFIASSRLASQPVYAVLTKTQWRVELIELPPAKQT